eukprot:scpid108407/ scgid7918/ 
MFGLLKRKLRRSDCYTLPQLPEVVKTSGQSNSAQLIPGSTVEWRTWGAFLSTFFRPVPGVSQHHHFEFSADKPGIVKVKKLATDAPESVIIMKATKEQDLAGRKISSHSSCRTVSSSPRTHSQRNSSKHVAAPYQDELC